jgi:hypothetical protein
MRSGLFSGPARERLDSVIAWHQQTRSRYAIFRRDARAQLLVDDCTSFRAVLVSATVEIREDIAAELPRYHETTCALSRHPCPSRYAVESVSARA